MYQPKFQKLTANPLIDYSRFPDSLLLLILKFETAYNVLIEEDEQTQKRLLPILVQTDSIISAKITALFNLSLPEKKPGTTKEPIVDKAKMLALKAKALQFKRK